MSESDDTLPEAFRQVTITILLVDAIQHIPSYAKFLKGLCTSGVYDTCPLGEL